MGQKKALWFLPSTTAEMVLDVGSRTVALLHVALSVICSVLTGNGRFAFETRNPLVRVWEKQSRLGPTTVELKHAKVP